MKTKYIAPLSEQLSLSVEDGILLTSVPIDETPQGGSEAWSSHKDFWENDDEQKWEEHF